MDGGWQRLAAAARQVEASAASVVVAQVLTNGGGANRGEEEGEEGAVAWARWWAEREARVVGALLHVARAHHRDERQQRVAHALEPAAGERAELEEEEERALAALEASTRRAEELEEALFRRSEMRSRRVCLAAHLRALPHHLARLFPTTTATTATTATATSWDEEGVGQEQEPGREGHQRLREVLQHRDQKVSSFLELHAELLQVERELEEARRARAAEEEATRRLWRQAKPTTRSRSDDNGGDQREDDDDGDGDRMDEGEETRRVGGTRGRRAVAALQEAEAENARLREVWQALILESGLNWAADEQLREVLFRLQSPLAFLPAPTDP